MDRLRRKRRDGLMHWRHRMRERWEQMTPEQREQFMAGMQRCWPFEPRAGRPTS